MATLRRLLLPAFLLCVMMLAPAAGQPPEPEYRALWIDTFNTRLATADEVRVVIARAAAMQVNALFVQVRRRGDAWYLDGTEPLGEGIGGGFDPLAEVLAQARPLGLEVHAFVTLGAVWNQATAPPSALHVFNRHGLGTGRAPDGRDNWLTRSLADGGGTSFDGYRFGNDFWLDPGHPDVPAYLTDVVVRLAQRYPVDGVHLDRVQYPEVAGAAGAAALSVGYNPSALVRYTRQTATTGLPSPDDPRFSEWRRLQVTTLLQRLYVSLLAVRPTLVVSVATTAAGAAPGDFRATEAFGRVFQDWQDWLARGSVDLAVPHVFRAAHQSAGADEFVGWMRWARATQARRATVVGLGAYLNSVEGTLHQVRQVRAAASAQPDEEDQDPTGAAPSLAGTALFSLAANNAPVVSNPLSIPAGRDTPLRAVEDLAAGLRFGRTTTGQSVDLAATGPFAEPATRPDLPWKTTEGHLLGEITTPAREPVDGALLRIERGTSAPAVASALSDGTGVFALPALPPGTYRLVATVSGASYPSSCEIEVAAAAVARVSVVLDVNRPALLECR